MVMLTCTATCNTSTSGIASAIIETLRCYDHGLPIGFIAKTLGQDRSTIDSYLIELKNKNIIIINEQNVILKKPEEKKE
jgi:hypothetical protein